MIKSRFEKRNKLLPSSLRDATFLWEGGYPYGTAPSQRKISPGRGKMAGSTVSRLALSVTFGDSSPKGRAKDAPEGFLPLPLGEVALR